jgi:hypothetical protein
MMSFETGGGQKQTPQETLSQETLIKRTKDLVEAWKQDNAQIDTLLTGLVLKMVEKMKLTDTTSMEKTVNATNQAFEHCKTRLEYALEQNPNLGAETVYSILMETVRDGLPKPVLRWQEEKNANNPPISTSRPTKQSDLKEDKAA